MADRKEFFSNNFIKTIITNDLKNGKVDEVVTRFPPEPNGYLHIGHARAIILNFEIANEYGGKTHLRFDDTNPTKEDVEYVEAIKNDVKWLGYEWDDLFFASDYFEEMYQRAIKLIEKGKAYVCDLSADEIRETRGTLTAPGKNSPYRDRSITDNKRLFEEMRAGKYEDGERVLRAKVDMSSPNINMRDPVIYRIMHEKHHNTGDQWCIYPMYTYAHPLEDSIEGITHSLCSLEFEDQRPFYDWVIRECEMPHVSNQYEFGKLFITNSISGKRHIRKLIDDGVLDGWDDPRVMTISGMRRRGFTPESIRTFIRETGVSRTNATVDSRMLDHFLREDLKLKAPRTMAILRPLKVVITNYPEGKEELLDAENNPENPDMGKRKIPFSREIYIEQEDFMEDPPKKYFRLYPGNEVRLRNAYFIKCEDVIKDEQGNIVEIHCTYDPETKSGTGFTGRKVKGTIHWVNARQALPAEFRLYEPLINDRDEEDEDSLEEEINPNSLEVLQGFVEPNMAGTKPNEKFQLFRHGYFNVDPEYTTDDKLVMNRIVSLRSSYQLPKE